MNTPTESPWSRTAFDLAAKHKLDYSDIIGIFHTMREVHPTLKDTKIYEDSDVACDNCSKPMGTFHLLDYIGEDLKYECQWCETVMVLKVVLKVISVDVPKKGKTE